MSLILIPQGITELVILKADRKHFDSIIGSKLMIMPSEENAEDKRVEPWKEEAGLGMALLLIGGADNHVGGAITKLG
jgi:hypothetical protein